MKSRRNKALAARVTRDGVLTIEIGVDTLAVAATSSPYAFAMAHDRNHPSDVLKVTDARDFAKDVVHALLDEDEDGSSLLTDMFDNAATDAIEAGAESFIDTREPR